MKKNWILMLSFILIIFALAACGNGDKTDKKSDGDDNQDANAELPEPDLEGIPDVVAEINGEEVTKDEFENMYQQQFQQAAMQAQMSGENVDQDELKEQTAEGIVGQKLLIQEAVKQISDVSDEDIDKTVDEVLEQNGMESKDELLDAFKEQGMDEKEFMSQIETQVKVNQLIAKEAGDIEPTDKEAEEAYETMKSQQEEMESDEEIPEFDEIKSELKAQLKQQKEAEATQTFVEKLRKGAEVKIYL